MDAFVRNYCSGKRCGPCASHLKCTTSLRKVLCMMIHFYHKLSFQSVFNFICQAVEPEILPPIFHLECPSPESCLSAHCRHKYELENAYGVNAAIIPSVLILKEGVIAFNSHQNSRSI